MGEVKKEKRERSRIQSVLDGGKSGGCGVDYIFKEGGEERFGEQRRMCVVKFCIREGREFGRCVGRALLVEGIVSVNCEVGE